ncbi:hypothetical protein [Roseateles chitinivorans]|uniref:hypothetical protein n=1 Tax=Roseateles chitinivorans TaxID=2917965 RepID=UPI003D66E7AB
MTAENGRVNSFFCGVIASASVIAAITLLTGAKAPPTKFEEIDVGRINVREPDGTLRMVISNRSQFPGQPSKDGERARPDRKDFAGMLFVNEDGEENGGLIQKGAIGPDGKARAGLSLSFDRYRQDQVIQLLHAEQGGQAVSMLTINDEADGTAFSNDDRLKRMNEIAALPADQARAAREQLRAEGKLPATRLRMGTTGSRSSALALADAKGRPRLMLMVTADGVPSITFMDEAGKTVKTVALDEPGR